MTDPEAGWLADPDVTHQLRWWDGTAWTEHRKPSDRVDAPALPSFSSSSGPMLPDGTRYVSMGDYGSEPTDDFRLKLSRGEKDRQTRRNNSFAYTGCVLALLGFLFNPFAILSILAIIFSAIGLTRSHDLEGRTRVTGRGTAIAGLVIGLVGLALFAWKLSQVF